MVVLHKAVAEEIVVILGRDFHIALGEDANVWRLQEVFFDASEKVVGVAEETGRVKRSQVVVDHGEAEGDLELGGGRGAGVVGLVTVDGEDGAIKTGLHASLLIHLIAVGDLVVDDVPALDVKIVGCTRLMTCVL